VAFYRCAGGSRVTEYRTSVDATVRFRNGGDLFARGFRVDVRPPDMDEDDDDIAAFVPPLAC
jgi:hypothetical protein